MTPSLARSDPAAGQLRLGVGPGGSPYPSHLGPPSIVRATPPAFVSESPIPIQPLQLIGRDEGRGSRSLCIPPASHAHARASHARAHKHKHARARRVHVRMIAGAPASGCARGRARCDLLRSSWSKSRRPLSHSNGARLEARRACGSSPSECGPNARRVATQHAAAQRIGAHGCSGGLPRAAAPESRSTAHAASLCRRWRACACASRTGTGPVQRARAGGCVAA